MGEKRGLGVLEVISVHLHCKSVVLNMNKLTRPYSGISGFREGGRDWILCARNVGWSDLRWMRVPKALIIHCVPSMFKPMAHKVELPNIN
jgi:hypothetical protein